MITGLAHTRAHGDVIFYYRGKRLGLFLYNIKDAIMRSWYTSMYSSVELGGSVFSLRWDSAPPTAVPGTAGPVSICCLWDSHKGLQEGQRGGCVPRSWGRGADSAAIWRALGLHRRQELFEDMACERQRLVDVLAIYLGFHLTNARLRHLYVAGDLSWNWRHAYLML